MKCNITPENTKKELDEIYNRHQVDGKCCCPLCKSFERNKDANSTAPRSDS